MATGDPLMDTINLVFDIFKYGWPLMIVLMLVIWKLRWKNYPVDAVIYEKRGSNIVKTNDRMGKFFDKHTNITGYRFMKTKDTIPVPNFEWILVCNEQKTNILEKIIGFLRPTIGSATMFKYGTKQYKSIEVKDNGKTRMKYVTIKDKEGKPIVINQYEFLDPRDKLKVLNFDVIDWDNMNFMVQEQRASAERRRSKSEFWKQIIIPIAMLGITGIICIVVIKMAFDYAATINPKAAEVPQEPAQSPNILNGIIPGT